MKDAIERLAAFRVWAPPVPVFLRKPETIQWLAEVQRETHRTVDESILLLLAGMRAQSLTILDGVATADELSARLLEWDADLRTLCATKHVQANIAERGLPILEVLGQRWKRQKLSVLELGCSFGVLGRVLVSAPTVLERFDRYFLPTQQRPDEVALVTSYHGIDLDPPDERWFLACIPVAEMRSRMARFVFEVPAEATCTVSRGSALSYETWPSPEPETVPIVLTSFMLYQLSMEQRSTLTAHVLRYTESHGGSWVNLDVRAVEGKNRFFVQVDGVETLDLKDDLCQSWSPHDR